MGSGAAGLAAALAASGAGARRARGRARRDRGGHHGHVRRRGVDAGARPQRAQHHHRRQRRRGARLSGRPGRRRRRRRARAGLRVRHAPRHRRDREPHADRVGGPRALARLPRRAARCQEGGTVAVAPGPAPGTGHRSPRPVRLRPALPGRRREHRTGTAAPADTATPANDGVVLRGHVRGRALAGGLLAAVVDAGVEVRTGARATRLAVEDGRVVGVTVDGQLQSGRVVLASGGFQHDAALVGELLGGPPIVAMGPAGCGGDGIAMARAAGAVLGNTAEGWWMPAMHAPGEDVDGVRHYRPLHGERAQPGAIMVDRTGDPLRRRGAELRRGGEGHAPRRCGGNEVPRRTVLDGVRRRLPPPLPRGPSRARFARPGVVGACRRSGRAGAAHGVAAAPRWSTR